PVRAVEELVLHDLLGDARRRDGPPKRLRPEGEEELVALARVDPDRAHAAQHGAVAFLARHAHGVPREPPAPYVVPQFAGLEVERELALRLGGGNRPRV